MSNVINESNELEKWYMPDTTGENVSYLATFLKGKNKSIKLTLFTVGTASNLLLTILLLVKISHLSLMKISLLTNA